MEQAGVALNPKPADLTALAGQHPDGDFAWKIANGRGPMPAWERSLEGESDLGPGEPCPEPSAGKSGAQDQHPHDHAYHH